MLLLPQIDYGALHVDAQMWGYSTDPERVQQRQSGLSGGTVEGRFKGADYALRVGYAAGRQQQPDGYYMRYFQSVTSSLALGGAL